MERLRINYLLFVLVLVFASTFYSCTEDEIEIEREEIITIIGLKSTEVIRLQVNKPCSIVISNLDMTINYDTINITNVGEWVNIEIPEEATLIYNEDRIAKLDCSNTSIVELKTNFDNVPLWINELNVSNCINLKELFCWRLSSLNVTGCSSLEILECGSNENLTSLDLSGCVSLDILACRQTGITSLDVSECTKINFIDVGFSEMTFLNVSGTSNLETLYIGKCTKMASIDLSDCINLKSLSCGRSNLNSLDISACILLSGLSCLEAENLKTISISLNERFPSHMEFGGCLSLNKIECIDAKNIDEVYSSIKNNNYVQDQCNIVINDNTEKYQYISGAWTKI